MAGGKKNQKKRKKKGWRAILDGCFNKTNFAVASSPEKRNEAAQGEGEASRPGCSTRPQRFDAPIYHADYRGENDPPIRGILKKSPTSSSCNSALYAEASTSSSIYYNPIYSDSVYSKRSLYPPQDENGFNRHSFTFGERLPVWDSNTSTSRSLGPSGIHGGLPALWSRYDGGQLQTRPLEPGRHSARETSYSGYAPRPLLHHHLEPTSTPQGRYYAKSAATSPSQRRGDSYAPAGGENRWSHPHPWAQNQGPRFNSLTSPLPSRRERNPLAVVLYSENPQDQQQDVRSPRAKSSYQPDQDPYRGDPHRFRPITSPPASWHGAAIASEDKRRRSASQPRNDYADLDVSSIEACEKASRSANPTPNYEHIRSSRYYSGGTPVPRVGDPIRKPMGSQFCPYSNPIYGIVNPGNAAPFHTPARAREEPIYANHVQVKNEAGTGYKVAQIYAAVCRSDVNAASSCVYASFSWKQSSGGNMDAPLPDDFPPLMDTLPIPPPLPPPMHSTGPWPSDTNTRTTSSKGSAHGHGRPPLPSYDEIINMRRTTSRARPASWCEYSEGKETERKREAFMNLLAQRYPQYADRIQGSTSGRSTPVPQQQQQQQQQPPQQHQPPIEKPARAREPQRRRTAVVSYDPAQATNTLEYDDLGTMSDLELPSFQRGNYMRTSLPIVRSASTSLERALGLVFLVHGEQTKKSLLPNEITTLDTVRALFVRAFPNLTMDMMEEARKKIYILDKNTNIYFQLEDLAEIVDRSVLKLHETDNEEPQRVRERQEVRGRTVQMPLSRPQAQGHPDNPDFIKAHSVPPQASQDYQEIMHDHRHQYEMERRSRSRTPEPQERPRSLSAGAATSRPRYSHSPDRLPTPERGPLNPIPENRQLTPGYREQGGNFYETIGPASPAGHRGQYPSNTYESVPPGGAYQGYTLPAHGVSQQAYMARGGNRAGPMMHPSRAAMNPIYDVRDGRGSNPARHSLAFAPNQMTSVDPPFQRSQSYRLPPERDQEYVRSHSATPTDNKTKNRIEKMEAQLASLTAWVHYQKTDNQQRREQHRGPRSLGSTTSDSSDTFPASSTSNPNGEITSLSTLATTNPVVPTKGLSDIPNGQRPPSLPSGDSSLKAVPVEISIKLSQLKTELHTLRRQQQLNMEAMRDEFTSAFGKIKTMCSSVPGAENQVYFHKRNDMTQSRESYLLDKEQVTKELIDLESTVEELRGDVISRKCRVKISDVEGMALLLSNITKNLADLKARFPELQEEMKTVMDGEMRVVVFEEKFLKEEPVEIEGCLKRCKKLTETLYTLKRLASVQDHRPPQVPTVNSTDGMADTDQKKMLLENIRAMVPDHDQRVQQMEQAADASRERKKKISVQQEALKFGKGLEMATKALRPPSTSEDKTDEEAEGKDKAQSGAVPNDSHVPTRNKSPVTIKPISSATTHPPVYSYPLTSSVATGIATSVTVPSSLVTSKPSFSSTLTSSAKLAASENSEVKESVIGSSETLPTHTKPPASMANTRSANLPLTQTTERLSHQVQAGTGPVVPTVTSLETSKRGTASGSSLHSVRPPVYSKPNTMGALMRKEKAAPLAHKEEFETGRERPKSSPGPHAPATYPKVTSTRSFDDSHQKKPEPNGQINGHQISDEKRSSSPAIYNSVNSPSKSSASSSPARNSFDASSSIAKVTSGGTINLILSGTVSPKSPTDPGTFTISPPIEIISPAANMDASQASAPSTPVKRDMSLSDDNISASGSPAHSDSNTKQKKVPPPPPPRKGSRPTSVSGMPTANGGINHQQPQDTPQFVGGVLGQHRLSGGPLSSTPKPTTQQRPMSTFEKDIASGIYANLNRPEFQSQNSSPQQMINQITSASASKNQENLPPTPSVTCNSIEREERGSSSESTSSSSGTSMGSQQSVVNIVRTGSLQVKPTKPKPEPPRRQSSLLAKSSCPGRDTLVHDRKKTLNGVDL